MTARHDASDSSARTSAADVSSWLVDEMARMADASPSVDLRDRDVAQAIGQCAALLSRFWPPEESDGSAADDSALRDSTDRDVQGGQSHPTMTAESSVSGNEATSASRLGRFEIRRALGHGGFGVVFLVFDPRLNREAALKIPRPEILMSAPLRQRFLCEAQAAAVLDHPGIVPIYETGEIGPVGYILSAYCKGPTLAAWLRQQSAISPGVAAEIVARLADAVHHAHSRGILHRDIKPSNVLLEHQPDRATRAFPFALRLSDFGLAKRLDEAGDETQLGSILGTPRYMAPEQAAGNFRDVGILADVYSLGVILYELLTGQPPFVGQSDRETLRMIAEAPLSPAALRAAGVSRDLETICFKCLEREPASRYQSARELTADLERYLAGEPVLARSIGRGQRFVRWCRRNRAVAALATAALVTLVAGTTFSTYYALAAGARARDAESSLRQARQAVDDSFTVLSEQTLLNEPGMQPLRKELLRTALAYYQDFVRDHADDPGLAAELARAHVRAGHIHETIGEHVEAEDQFRKAIKIRESLAEQDPTSLERRRDLADGYAALAIWQGFARHGDETEPLFKKVIALREALVRGDPNDDQIASDLGVSYQMLAALYTVERRNAEANALLLKSAELRERLVEEHPENAKFQSDLSVSYHKLGISHIDAGRRPEAKEQFRKAIAIQESLVEAYPAVGDYKRELAQSYKHLARTHNSAGELEPAADLLSRAIALHEKLAHESPTVVRFQRDLADGYDDRARLQMALGRQAEAEKSFRAAIDVQSRLISQDPSIAGYQVQFGGYCWDLMKLLYRTNRVAEAREWYCRGMEARQILVREDPKIDNYWFSLAHGHLYGAQSPDLSSTFLAPDVLYARAIELFEAHLGKTSPYSDLHSHLIECYTGVAMLNVRVGNGPASEEALRDAIAQHSPGTADAGAQPDANRALALLHARLAVQTAIDGGDWTSVAASVKQAAALAPHDAIIHILCSDAAALAGNWSAAAEPCNRGLELSDLDLTVAQRAARLQYISGDQSGYRATAARIVDRYAATSAPRKAYLIVMTCVLGEQALNDMAPVVSLARRCLEVEPTNPAMMTALGAALYRSGQIEQAAKLLAQSLPLHCSKIERDAEGRDESRVVQLTAARMLALAYRDLGKTDELNSLLPEIRRKLAELSELNMPESARIMPWSFRFAVEMTRQELGPTLTMDFAE